MVKIKDASFSPSNPIIPLIEFIGKLRDENRRSGLGTGELNEFIEVAN